MKKMKNSERGFTLSEVVITLVVLGIVAAITVPMLSNSASDKKWNVGRQKAQATIGEAFRLMTVNGEIDKNLSTQQFVEKVMPKYLKLAKTCLSSTECGFSSKVKTTNGVTRTLPKSWTESTDATMSNFNNSGITVYNHSNPNTNGSYYFKTLDGFSVSLLYNPYCVSGTDTKERYKIHADNWYYQQVMDVICFNAVYDMNGKKGPNKVGMDIGFVGSFYNGYQARSVAVLPHYVDKSISGSDVQKSALTYCNNIDKDGNWKLPNLDELSLIYMNLQLVKNPVTDNYIPISSTKVKDSANRFMTVVADSYNRGCLHPFVIGTQRNDFYARCVRANTLK